MATRREFILRSMLTTAGISSGLNSFSKIDPNRVAIDKPGAFTINVFSKNFHWLDYQAMAATVADLGFDGIDLTVRPEGHVTPDRVTTDLPKAVEAINKAGLKVHMMTTAIVSADDPFTEPILKTAASLGISYYRMGWMNYDDRKSVTDNLKSFRIQMEKLSLLNEKYNIHGDYQNHSGSNLGAPVWDLYNVLDGLNAKWIGIQYDIMHATVEGANAWPLGFKLLKPYVNTIDIKDFQWNKKETGWKADVVPLGEGMIDYKKYLQLLKESNVSGPFSMHFEYPLGGVENGAKTLTIKKEEVLSAMKRDLAVFKKMLTEAGIKKF